MKHAIILLFSAAFVADAALAPAQGEDPILAKLDQSRRAYDASEEAFRKGVLARIAAAEEKAVKAGKKAAVDQAVADRQAFEATGALPATLKVGDLQTKREQARSELQGSFAKAISELTKARRGAEADALEREAQAFKSSLAGDLVKPGTVWRGEKRYIKGGPAGVHPIELRVLERNGDSFKGIINEDTQSHDVEGSVKGDKVEWKNTRVRLGPYPGQPQAGTIEGESMKLHFVRRDGFGGVPVEAQGLVKLQKKK